MSKTFDVVSPDAEGASDRDLVAAFQEGHLWAFAEIYVRHRRNAQRVCRRFLRNPQDIEEAVQETMLRAFRSLPEFNGEYALRSWVERIATNFCLDTLRARARRRGVVEEIEFSEEDADTYAGSASIPDPSEVVEALFVVDEVREILEKIPQHHRKALVMREIEGRSHAEIGDALGVSDSQAKSLIHRAKKTFRRVWKEGGRRLSGFLPPFLFPSKMWALASRYAGPASPTAELATTASNPAVSASVTSAGEKIATAVTAIAAAGAISVGALVSSPAGLSPERQARGESTASAAPQEKPAPPSVAQTVPVSEDPVPVAGTSSSQGATNTAEAEPTAKPSPRASPSPTAPGASDANSADEGSEETWGASPSPAPSGAAPAWGMGFMSTLSTSSYCECDPTPRLLSSDVSGKAGEKLTFRQEAEGAALDSEGDPAWGLLIEYGGQIDQSTGSIWSSFYLGGYGYTASAAVVKTSRTSDGAYAYTFMGGYRLTDGDPPQEERVPREGTFTSTLYWWGDRTTLYRSEFSLSEK